MKLLVILLCLYTLSLTAQKKDKLTTYTAKNGINYKVGDILWLGKGSGEDGSFQYVKIGGWAKKLSSTPMKLSFKNENRPFTIKKMYKYRSEKWKSVHLTLGSDSSTNYSMDLDNALKSGEVKQTIEKRNNSPSLSFDKYDQIAKLKKLFDDGALTKEEFESEKTKLLSSE
ncbi:SHOCT domain-containing protein [Arenibacter sp. TNZ]|uniref:SHOCT domain-containing protein n=1 Tax=Arenibacter TaxID=178469 RepID=UPI000CD3CD33|nr:MULTISPECIES: SHOCT domain-containing protein [Arenibacter]MCM4170060.1 SHOCT domain-containing protein [Arenibacter sp. TNZ]